MIEAKSIKSIKKGYLAVRFEKPAETTTKAGIIIPIAGLDHFAEGGNRRFATNLATVVKAYDGCRIPEGAKVRLHHLVWDNAQAKGPWLDENTCLIPYNMVYYYYKEDGSIQAVGQFMLGVPYFDEEQKTQSGLIVSVSDKPVSSMTWIISVGDPPPGMEPEEWIQPNTLVVHRHKKDFITVQVSDNTEDRVHVVWNEFVTATVDGVTAEDVKARAETSKSLIDEYNKIATSHSDLVAKTPGRVPTQKRREYFV